MIDPRVKSSTDVVGVEHIADVAGKAFTVGLVLLAKEEFALIDAVNLAVARRL